MLQVDPHHIFLMLVNSAATIKDIQTGKTMAATAIANVMDIDSACLEDYSDDMEALARMTNEYIRWQYMETPRPAWILFYNGKLI